MTSTKSTGPNRLETAPKRATFHKLELNTLRALVREVLGDRAPRGVVEVSDVQRHMPRDFTVVQTAAVYALGACEAIHSIAEIGASSAEQQETFESGALHARAAELLGLFADCLSEKQAATCRRIASSLVNDGWASVMTDGSEKNTGDAKPMLAEAMGGHRLETRRGNILTPTIRSAQAECNDPHDPNEVWVKLMTMAHERIAPLYGVEEAGIQYLGADGEPQLFKRSSLAQRLKRQCTKPR